MAKKQLDTGDLGRRAAREAERQRLAQAAAAKLAAIRAAVQSTYPTANIEDMNHEIELGYLK